MSSPLQPLQTAAAPGNTTPERWPDRLWRLAMDYLPFVLVLLLALSTTWLVRSMPGERTATPPPPANEPDYFMRHFDIRNYDRQGVLRSSLQGVAGDHTPDGDTIRTQQPRSLSVDEKGLVTRGAADRSVSDRKATHVELFGNVKVLRDSAPDAQGKPQPPLQLESEYLKLINRQEHISTDKPVRITRGQDVMNGSGLDYTGASRQLDIHGRVNATLQPVPAKP